MRTIAEALEQQRNNFDAIRLLAALLVLFSHSYPLVGESFEPIYHFLAATTLAEDGLSPSSLSSADFS
jgi:peptidoglycan/LPS O-acetylase OafA/YrhL